MTSKGETKWVQIGNDREFSSVLEAMTYLGTRDNMLYGHRPSYFVVGGDYWLQLQHEVYKRERYAGEEIPRSFKDVTIGMPWGHVQLVYVKSTLLEPGYSKWCGYGEQA